MKDLDHLKLPRAGETSSRFTKEQALAAQKFHQTLPGYSVTRLVELPALAKELGVKDIFVKDEASRFGLNSFKGLGCRLLLIQRLQRFSKDRVREDRRALLLSMKFLSEHRAPT